MSKIPIYQKKLKDLTKKIVEEYTVEKSDLDELIKLYKLCKISDGTLMAIHKGCNFETWEDYIAAKRSEDPDQWEFVECVDGNLERTTDKILAYTSSMA